MNIEQQVIKNKADINNRKEICDDFREQITDNVDKIWDCMNKITNHYSKKPTWPILFIISFLSSLTVGLLVGIIMTLLKG